MEGGHADIDGMQIINTPIGFELEKGATVDLRNVTQTFTRSAPGRKKRRKRKADPQR